jgi:AcrR family transcriptional regulator
LLLPTKIDGQPFKPVRQNIFKYWNDMKNTKQRILQAATELFDTRGINASGIDTIIAQSGIAKASLYKYFPSKNDLIIEYLEQKSARLFGWLNQELANRNSSAKENLFAVCELFEQWMTTPDFQGLPFHIASVEFPDPTHPVNSCSVELSKALQQYLAKLAKQAGIKQAKTLAYQLAIIFEGGAMLERLNPKSGAAKRAKAAAMTLIQSYL